MLSEEGQTHARALARPFFPQSIGQQHSDERPYVLVSDKPSDYCPKSFPQLRLLAYTSDHCRIRCSDKYEAGLGHVTHRQSSMNVAPVLSGGIQVYPQAGGRLDVWPTAEHGKTGSRIRSGPIYIWSTETPYARSHS